MSQDVAGKDRAVIELARGRTCTEAAQAAGMSRRTVSRWRGDPAFRREVAEMRAGLLADATGVLCDAAADAARYLADVARGDELAKTPRVNAARLVLTLAPQLVEHGELAERVAALEEAQPRQDGP